MDTAIDFLPTNTPGCPANDVRPAPGLPARYTIGSDTYAGFVRKVARGGLTVYWARTMDALESDWDAFTRRQDGRYRLRNCNYGYLSIGDTRGTELDPGF